MGLFDKAKEKVKEVANEFKMNCEEASQLEIYELCNALKDMKMLDKKLAAYKTILNQKCEQFGDTHHAKEPIEAELVQRHMYIRSEDGTLNRNMLYRNRS